MQIPQEEQHWINQFVQHVRSEDPMYIADGLANYGVNDPNIVVSYEASMDDFVSRNQKEWNKLILSLIPDDLRPAVRAHIMADLCGPDGVCGPEYGYAYLREWSRWILTQLI